jgi:SAM-dependent methyltransferase
MCLEECATSIFQEPDAQQARDVKEYWANCADSHFATEDYYEAQKRLLLKLAPHITDASDRIADDGCGNGFFTLERAPYCREIFGYDISAPMIEEARRAAAERGIAKATFQVLEIEAGLPDQEVDVIACMGVFSTLPGQGAIERTLARFAALLPSGGLRLRALGPVLVVMGVTPGGPEEFGPDMAIHEEEVQATGMSIQGQIVRGDGSGVGVSARRPDVALPAPPDKQGWLVLVRDRVAAFRHEDRPGRVADRAFVQPQRDGGV